MIIHVVLILSDITTIVHVNIIVINIIIIVFAFRFQAPRPTTKNCLMTSIAPSRAVYESDLPFSLVRCMF